MRAESQFEFLREVCRRPEPFSEYTAQDLWNDPHISRQMLEYHLDPTLDISSRNHDFIARSADWLVDRFELGAGARVIDFGCGPGLYTQRLAGHELDVTGIDFSSNSIRYARENSKRDGLDIEYIEANYLEFETDRQFDLVMMIMCDFCALSPDQRAVLLDKFNSMVAPGGSILLDVYGVRMFEQREESITFAPNLMDGFWADHDYFGFWQSFKYTDLRLILDKYTIVDETDIQQIYNWLQCFTPDGLAMEFSQHGLQIDEYLGSVGGDAYDETGAEFAVVASPR